MQAPNTIAKTILILLLYWIRGMARYVLLYHTMHGPLPRKHKKWQPLCLFQKTWIQLATLLLCHEERYPIHFVRGIIKIERISISGFIVILLVSQTRWAFAWDCILLHGFWNFTVLVYTFTLRHMMAKTSQIITLTSQWLRWRLKSPAWRLFTQPFIQTQIRENIKAPRHWPLCGEFTVTGEFPA